MVPLVGAESGGEMMEMQVPGEVHSRASTPAAATTAVFASEQARGANAQSSHDNIFPPIQSALFISRILKSEQPHPRRCRKVNA
jgi:hypothetical protein